MTIEDIDRTIERIKSAKGDDEIQHGVEDDLHVDFIRHIAEHGTVEQQVMAKRILSIRRMNFGRWCA